MLTARNIEFIEVKSTHDRDIIEFCGVPEHGIEQELIFSKEDPYLIPTKPYPTPLLDLEGSYVVRFEDNTLHVFTKSIFTGLFSLCSESKLREENIQLNAEYERLRDALNYIYESGYLRNEADEKARWGLGLPVENPEEIAALKPRV